MCLRCCMAPSQRRMLLLWVCCCCCSRSAFDSLHVCASWARDVKCLWINWWRLLYSECCFFFFPPQLLKIVSFGVCWRAAYSRPTKRQMCFNSRQEITPRLKQFHSVFQFRIRDARLKAHLLSQLVFSPVYRNISLRTQNTQRNQNTTFIYETKEYLSGLSFPPHLMNLTWHMHLIRVGERFKKFMFSVCG